MNGNGSGLGSIGFFGLLTICFIVLKLCGVIGWPWVGVLAPVWVPAAIILLVALIVSVMRR